MATKEAVSRVQDDVSKAEGDFAHDIKPCIIDSSHVTSSAINSKENQGHAASSNDAYFTSSSAMNLSKSSTNNANDRDKNEDVKEFATLPSTPLCQGKTMLPPSNPSNLAANHQNALSTEENGVMGNNRSWVKTEPASTVRNSSRETSSGEFIPGETISENAVAQTSQSQLQSSDNHSRQRACFACWICFEKFDTCLDVKKHLLKKHKNSKVLCAYTQMDSDSPSTPPQLLMYCPNKCDYVTAKLYAFPHHVSNCDKPALHTTGMAYFNSTGNLVSGNIIDNNEENECKRKTRSRSARLKGSWAGKQEGTSGKANEKEIDSIGAEDWNDNYTCQRCKLIFSSSFFLERHEKQCCSGNFQEFAPDNSGPLTAATSTTTTRTTITTTTTTARRRKSNNEGSSPPQQGRSKRSKNTVTQTTSSRKKEYSCKVCKQVFNHVKSFRAHVKRHTNKPFKCTLCDRSFRTTILLDAHIRIHKGQEPFQCEKCGKSYKRANSLYEHKLTHTEERPFKCEECGRGFQKKCILTSHMRTHTGEKPYQCSVCGKSFAQCGSLSKHLKTHLEEKPYACNECGVRFKEKRTHIIHMRKHKGEELFQCEQCGKCCYHSAMLRRHMMTHTDEKPFVCNECGKRFRKATDLKRHMRVHTGEKPYQCKVCTKRFARSAHLTVHQRSHTGEKPYHCQLCDKRFMHNISLRIHTKSHHEKQNSQMEHKPVRSNDAPQSCQVPRYWGDNPAYSGVVPPPGAESVLSNRTPHGWYH